METETEQKPKWLYLLQFAKDIIEFYTETPIIDGKTSPHNPDSVRQILLRVFIYENAGKFNDGYLRDLREISKEDALSIINDFHSGVTKAILAVTKNGGDISKLNYTKEDADHLYWDVLVKFWGAKKHTPYIRHNFFLIQDYPFISLSICLAHYVYYQNHYKYYAPHAWINWAKEEPGAEEISFLGKIPEKAKEAIIEIVQKNIPQSQITTEKVLTAYCAAIIFIAKKRLEDEECLLLSEELLETQLFGVLEAYSNNQKNHVFQQKMRDFSQLKHTKTGEALGEFAISAIHLHNGQKLSEYEKDKYYENWANFFEKALLPECGKYVDVESVFISKESFGKIFRGYLTHAIADARNIIEAGCPYNAYRITERQAESLFYRAVVDFWRAEKKTSIGACPMFCAYEYPLIHFCLILAEYVLKPQKEDISIYHENQIFIESLPSYIEDTLIQIVKNHCINDKKHIDHLIANFCFTMMDDAKRLQKINGCGLVSEEFLKLQLMGQISWTQNYHNDYLMRAEDCLSQKNHIF